MKAMLTFACFSPKLTRLRPTPLLFFNKRFGSTQLTSLLPSLEPHHGFVVVSKSRDIYRNLALEDWFYKRAASLPPERSAGGLLIWYNDPAIVVGRHQSPWTECHIERCLAHGVAIARRNSGGGTVYHDQDNLNVCFFSSRKKYNRKENLLFITRVLKSRFDIDAEVSPREDLVLSDGGYKISGTASKLGSNSAYHHCTLLVDVQMDRLRSCIKKDSPNIESKATESVRSRVKNLRSVCSDVSVESLVVELTKQFVAQNNGRQGSTCPIIEVSTREEQFKGINDIEATFRSWDWIYGKTPRFSVNSCFDSTLSSFCKVRISVFRGLIEDLDLEEQNEIKPDLRGTRFSAQHVSEALGNWMESQSHSDRSLLVSSSILNAVRGAYS